MLEAKAGYGANLWPVQACGFADLEARLMQQEATLTEDQKYLDGVVQHVRPCLFFTFCKLFNTTREKQALKGMTFSRRAGNWVKPARGTELQKELVLVAYSMLVPGRGCCARSMGTSLEETRAGVPVYIGLILASFMQACNDVNVVDGAD